MLVVEITLGIVLAVVILAFWRQILGAGILIVGAILCLALAGMLVYWGFQHTDEILVTVALVGTLAIGGGLVAFVSRKSGFTFDEIMCFVVVVAGLLFAGVMGVTYYQRSSELPVELLYMLPFVGLLIAGTILVVFQIVKRKRLAARDLTALGPKP